MALQHVQNPYRLLEYGQYLELVADFLERLNPGICIERLFGHAPDRQLVGPRWGKSAAEIRRDIEQELARRNTRQGSLWSAGIGRP